MGGCEGKGVPLAKMLKEFLFEEVVFDLRSSCEEEYIG